MEHLGGPSPPLPSLVLYPVAILATVIMIWVMLRLRQRAGGFVFFAMWLRYLMSAFHEFSFQKVVAGLSANALTSVLMVGVGLTQIKLRHLRLNFLVPFYLLMLAMIASAIFSGSMSSLVGVLTKCSYLVVITIGVYEALSKQSDGRLFKLLPWAFLTPLLLQIFSVVLHVAKQTENDESVSYIGGYEHEATFSVILMTCVIVLTFTGRMNKTLKTLLLLAFVAGIYLANYRTTVLSVIPALVMFFGFAPVQKVVVRDRPLVVSAMILFSCIVLGVLALMLAERFSDVGTVATGQTNLFKPPDQYTDAESRLLSGRPYIWSKYIFGWLAGTNMQHLFGFGPDTWGQSFTVYAHNTLVNTLYENGWVGVFATLYMWFSMLVAALRVRHPHKARLVAAHVSFLVLNMSTMPMWMIEGNVLYGIICGYTLYLLSISQKQPTRARAVRRAPMAPHMAPQPAPGGAPAPAGSDSRPAA